jgi:hypothetical protein
LTELVIGILAAYRIAHILQHEQGLMGVGTRFRTFTNNHPSIEPLGWCLKCLSVWIGLFCAIIIGTGLSVLLLPFAISEAVILLGRVLDG